LREEKRVKFLQSDHSCLKQVEPTYRPDEEDKVKEKADLPKVALELHKIGEGTNKRLPPRPANLGKMMFLVLDSEVCMVACLKWSHFKVIIVLLLERRLGGGLVLLCLVEGSEIGDGRVDLEQEARIEEGLHGRSKLVNELVGRRLGKKMGNGKSRWFLSLRNSVTF